MYIIINENEMIHLLALKVPNDILKIHYKHHSHLYVKQNVFETSLVNDVRKWHALSDMHFRYEFRQ